MRRPRNERDAGLLDPFVCSEFAVTRDVEFLTALAADPRDESTRLVYADWLEEQGDPRGTYLRIEHRMAATSPFESAYWDLKLERNELRKGLDLDWLEAVGYPTYYAPLFSQLPPSRDARWRLVDRFIDTWHQPLTRHSGNTLNDVVDQGRELGVPIPEALGEWYRLAGGRMNLWTGQDETVPLAAVQFRKDALRFRWENQGCEIWGVRVADTALKDPPVVRTQDDNFEGGRVDSDSVTSFAIQTLMYETVMANGRRTGHTDSADRIREWIETHCRRCEVSNRYWALAPVYFYESRDFLVIDSHIDDYAYVAARTNDAVSAIPDHVAQYIEWHESDGVPS